MGYSDKREVGSRELRNWPAGRMRYGERKEKEEKDGQGENSNLVLA